MKASIAKYGTFCYLLLVYHRHEPTFWILLALAWGRPSQVSGTVDSLPIVSRSSCICYVDNYRICKYKHEYVRIHKNTHYKTVHVYIYTYMYTEYICTIYSIHVYITNRNILCIIFRSVPSDVWIAHSTGPPVPRRQRPVVPHGSARDAGATSGDSQHRPCCWKKSGDHHLGCIKTGR